MAAIFLQIFCYDNLKASSNRVKFVNILTAIVSFFIQIKVASSTQ